MKKLLTLAVLFVTYLCFLCEASADHHIRIIGSSTLYPFVTVVAEKFGKKFGGSTPIVESTGTGRGFKLFCGKKSVNKPDIVTASRKIKQSEVSTCHKHGINDTLEIIIGYDGIILASSKKTKQYSLTKEQIFLALAKIVPKEGQLIENPYQKWSDISPTLPASNIEIYGPPATSGTRFSFIELVMENICLDIKEFKNAFPDPAARKNQCRQIREDGKFIEAGDSDNFIIQKLSHSSHALGIFGYNFLEQNQRIIHASVIDGVTPSDQTISKGSYKISRPLYIYLRKSELNINPQLKSFIEAFINARVIGPNGYLIHKGLIPISEKELEIIKNNVLG